MREHLRNLSLGWAAFGWFIGAALTSLFLLVLAALDLGPPGAAAETIWVAGTLLVGFFLAGLFVGTRVAAAPILNGVAMAVYSLVAWIVINVLVGEPFNETTWRSLEAGSLLALLLIQGAASVVGARIAVRWMRSPPGAA